MLTMKHGEKVLCLAVSLTFCLGVRGVTIDSNPYQGIVDRNVFGLKDPPPPPRPEDNKPPPTKIILTGITTILGNKRALLKTPPTGGPAKPGSPPPGEHSYIMTIGQKEDDIEILEIDEKANTVKVNNAGAIVTLNFDKDGQKSSVGSAAPGPGLPPPPTGLPQPPGMAAPAGFNPPSNPNFQRPIRTAAPGSASVTPQGMYGNQASAQTQGTGLFGVPQASAQNSQGTMALSTQPSGMLSPSQFKSWPPNDTTMSHEEQVAMYLLQKQSNPKVEYPPLPDFDESTMSLKNGRSSVGNNPGQVRTQ
jgi:hypothetical protein